MTKTHRLLLALCITALIPFNAFSDALVVDDSENFTLLDEPQDISRTLPEPGDVIAYNDNDPSMAYPNQKEQPAVIDDQLPMTGESHQTDTSDERPLAFESDEPTNRIDENVQLLDRLQALQQEVQELRGQLEIQAHDLKLLQQQQLAFYKDLDGRINRTTPATATPNKRTDLISNNRLQLDSSDVNQQDSSSQITTLSKTEKINPANEQISYLAAYELIKNKKYDDALNAMNTFVYQYPQSGYTANAQYWLGELYLVKKDYRKAITHFDTVLQRYPSSSKSAASLLKIGYALAADGNKDEARQRLQHVISNYPDTNAAQLAAAKLKSIGG